LETVEKAQIVIDRFKAKLEWNKEFKLKLVQCPHDSNHWVSSKNLQKHASKCKWKVLGYTSDEVNEIQESENMSNSKSHGIIQKLFPDLNPMELLTYEKYTTLLTSQQRLQLYDESVSLCKNVIKDNDPFLYENLDKDALKKLSSKNASPSNINIIKELRDFKRRRRTYRAKNVAVTKRSYTEVLRDVLKTHMENLQQSLETTKDIRFSRNRNHERAGDDEKYLSSKKRTADSDIDRKTHKTSKSSSSRKSHHRHHQDDKRRHEYDRSEDEYRNTDHKAHKRKKSKKHSKISKRKKDFVSSPKRHLK